MLVGLGGLAVLAGAATFTWYGVTRRRSDYRPSQYPLAESSSPRAAEVARAPESKFITIQPGRFLMGSPTNEEGRDLSEYQRYVDLAAFAMQTMAVTQSQWTGVMGTNPSAFIGSDLPVEQVSWNDAVEFCRRLSEKEGKRYRLPTEAEWECVCRAGTTTPFYTGASEADLAEAGWYSGNSDSKTHPVAQKKPNAWGFYDTHGNVWQWCSDSYYPLTGGKDFKGSSDTAQVSRFVVRGGSWFNEPRFCRAAYRFGYAPDYRSSNVGLRLCQDV